MRFHVGQDVYIGYTPRVKPAARRYLCSVGTIDGGPFPPFAKFPEHGYIPIDDTSWFVVIDGQRFLAAQRILWPFDDADAHESVTEQEVAA